MLVVAVIRLPNVKTKSCSRVVRASVNVRTVQLMVAEWTALNQSHTLDPVTEFETGSASELSNQLICKVHQR